MAERNNEWVDPRAIPIMMGDTLIGVGTIDNNSTHITINIDMVRPAGQQLLEFLEKYPEMISIGFTAKPGYPVNHNKEKN